MFVKWYVGQKDCTSYTRYMYITLQYTIQHTIHGTTSVHRLPSCHFPNVLNLNKPANQGPGSVRPLSFLGGRSPRILFGGQLVHFSQQTLTFLILLFFSNIIEILFSLFKLSLRRLHGLPPTTDPRVDSLAFAPPCIYKNRTTTCLIIHHSRRPRCGLQRGCSMQQCLRLLA